MFFKHKEKTIKETETVYVSPEHGLGFIASDNRSIRRLYGGWMSCRKAVAALAFAVAEKFDDFATKADRKHDIEMHKIETNRMYSIITDLNNRIEKLEKKKNARNSR